MVFYYDMKARLICYTLGNVDHQTRSRFKREFFGYVDRSNNHQYKYKRKGLLSDTPHSKPIRSSVIVKPKDEARIIRFLKGFKAEIKRYWIIIDKKELKIP